jgi:hypothetical protein
MSRINKKTFERCVICDRNGELETPTSIFADSTTYNRDYVVIRIQFDGKPVCSACMGSAWNATNELAEITEDDAWKADELGWLFGEKKQQPIKRHVTPEAARKELEALINEWRWEDLEQEKTSVASNTEEIESV